MATQNCVIFKINQSLYAVDVSQAGEVEKDIKIQAVPGMPSCLLGMAEIRNTLVPVIAVRKHFGLPPLMNGESYDVIVTQLDGMFVAYQVDSVFSITTMDFMEINAAPEIVKSTTGCVQKVTELNGQVVILIDFPKLLTAQETEDLKEFMTKDAESAE